MFQGVLAALLQASLFAHTEASPIKTQVQNNQQYGIGGGIVGFIVLVLDIIVWIEVLQSTRPISHKVLWALLVFLFPIVGIILYFLLSNRGAHKRGYEAIPG